MLILSRKQGERIRIGEDVWLTVVAIRHDSVRIGIDAPRATSVDREEIRQRKLGLTPRSRVQAAKPLGG